MPTRIAKEDLAGVKVQAVPAEAPWVCRCVQVDRGKSAGTRPRSKMGRTGTEGEWDKADPIGGKWARVCSKGVPVEVAWVRIRNKAVKEEIAWMSPRSKMGRVGAKRVWGKADLARIRGARVCNKVDLAEAAWVRTWGKAAPVEA
jgi:hypothetical protein